MPPSRARKAQLQALAEMKRAARNSSAMTTNDEPFEPNNKSEQEASHEGFTHIQERPGVAAKRERDRQRQVIHRNSLRGLGEQAFALRKWLVVSSPSSSSPGDNYQQGKRAARVRS
ncbi:MAG: hypothetical protein SGPRY_014401, partial [Prymnesium sp.]